MASTVHHQQHPTTAYPKYKYERIDLATDAIRLLRIFKGPYDSPVRCHMFESYLDRDKGVPYEALSYAWGDLCVDKVTIDIVNEVNGAPSSLKVYPNLYEILRHLRQPDKDRVIWVDAVCIDQDQGQDCHRERTHQVGQMRLVYENAERVIVWLGDFDVNVQMLMKFAQKLDARALEDPTNASSATNAWELRFQEEMANYGLKGDDNTQYQRLRSTMSHLLGRPWFTRTWIIQEVASAKTVVVMCPGLTGRTMSVSTRTFTLLPSLMGLVPDLHVQAILDVMPVKGQLRRGWWNEQRSLKTLLVKFQGSKCSDSRDSVYALLGICSDTGVNNIIKADYKISEELVLKKTLSYLLFSEIVDEQTCRLPGDTATFLEALNHPTGLPQGILEWACGNGSVTTVQRLLDLRETKCVALGSEWSPLAAEDFSDLARKRRSLSNEVVDVNACITGSEYTLLHTAVNNGHEEVVRALLTRREINTNSKVHGDTPLHHAIKAGETSIAKILIEHNDTDVNLPDSDGTPSLLRAMMNWKAVPGIAETLRKHKDIDAKLAWALRPDNLAPLSLAVITGDGDKFDQIFEPKRSRGRNLHKSEINEALHWAFKAIKATSIYGWRALERSRIANEIWEPRNELVDVNWKDGSGDTLLGILSKSPNLIEFLNINRPSYGPSRHFQELDVIHHSQTNLNMTTRCDGHHGTSEMTPLKIAAIYGHDVMVRELLDVGGPSQSKTKDHDPRRVVDLEAGLGECCGTALWAAVSQGHQDVASSLLKNGAHRESKGWHAADSDSNPTMAGVTPLWQAVHLGNIQMVELLISRGADLRTTGRALHQTATGLALDEEERTLMEEARFHGFNDIVELLSKHEAAKAGDE